MTVPEKAAVACNLPGQSMSQPASEPPSTQSLRARSHRHVRMTVPGRQAAKRCVSRAQEGTARKAVNWLVTGSGVEGQCHDGTHGHLG